MPSSLTRSYSYSPAATVPRSHVWAGRFRRQLQWARPARSKRRHWLRRSPWLCGPGCLGRFPTLRPSHRQLLTSGIVGPSTPNFPQHLILPITVVHHPRHLPPAFYFASFLITIQQERASLDFLFPFASYTCAISSPPPCRSSVAPNARRGRIPSASSRSTFKMTRHCSVTASSAEAPADNSTASAARMQMLLKTKYNLPHFPIMSADPRRACLTNPTCTLRDR